MCEQVVVLPYRQDALESLATQKNAGRRLILESDLPPVLAQAIADHLGVFDEIRATQPAAVVQRNSFRDVGSLIRALRPHQWLKNLLLLLPLILAHVVE